MGKSEYSPVKDFSKKLWEDSFKNWFDLKAYLSQRKDILSNPACVFSDDKQAQENWKSPLLFAIQGMVFVAILLATVGFVFSTFIEPRPTIVFTVKQDGDSAYIIPQEIKGGAEWKIRREIVEKDISILRKKLEEIKMSDEDSAHQGPIPYSQRDNQTSFMLGVAIAMSESQRDEAISKYDAEISKLEEQLNLIKLAPNIEKAENIIQKVSVPISIIFAAYLFRRLIRFTNKSNSAHLSRAHVIYLYYFTSSLFWVNLTYALLLAIKTNVEKYFPPQMDSAVENLESALRSIDGETVITSSFIWNSALSLGFLICFLWGYRNIRKVAKKLREPLEIEAADSIFKIYSGEAKIRKDLIVSNLVSFLTVGIFADIAALVFALSLEHLNEFKI